MLSIVLMSMTALCQTSDRAAGLLAALEAPDAWRSVEVARAIDRLPPPELAAFLGTVAEQSPHARLALIELLSAPGTHLGGVILACGADAEPSRALGLDIIERIAVQLQHRRQLDGIEADAERRSQRIFAMGLVIGEREPTGSASIPVLIAQLDRFGGPARPIILDPRLAAALAVRTDVRLMPEPAEAFLARILGRIDAEVVRLPSCFFVTHRAAAGPRRESREDRDGQRQLEDERKVVRALATSLRRDAPAAERCAALVGLVRLGLYGAGSGLLKTALEGGAGPLALDAVAAAGALGSGEELSAAAPALLAGLLRATDDLERYLLVEALCRCDPARVREPIERDPALLERREVIHIVARLRLHGLLPAIAGRAIDDPRTALEACRAALVLGEPEPRELRAWIVRACELPEAPALLASQPSLGVLAIGDALDATSGTHELAHHLRGPEAIPCLIGDTTLSLDRRLHVILRLSLLDEGPAVRVMDAAQRERSSGGSRDGRLLAVAWAARQAAARGAAITLSPAESDAVQETFVRGDGDDGDLAELAANLGHPVATELLLKVLQRAPDARPPALVERVQLAVERLGFRLAAGASSQLGQLQVRLEDPLKTKVLHRDALWSYQVAEDVGRRTVLLDEVESFSP